MILRIIGYLFAFCTISALVVAGVVAYIIWENSQDLPDYEVLANYEPPVTTRIHATDGTLLAEYAEQRRLYLPYDALPRKLIEAFISAEDKRFFDHKGVDPYGVLRAVVANVKNIGKNRRLEGASTITQQVAKNFLLTNERTYKRKIREALLAMRIETAFSKEQILELYLNEIYFGQKSYGIAAASLNYFGKSVNELTLAEMAYLAALPKAPENYHPFRRTEKAIERRNWVLDRMADNGFIDQADAETAKQQPLEVSPRPFGARIFAAEYFAEEVRRQLSSMLGSDKYKTAGLSVRTTLNPQLQVLARKVLVDGLVKYDRRQGYRGPVTVIDDVSGDWGEKLAEVKSLRDVAPWRLGVVLEVNSQRALVGLKPNKLPSGKVEETRQNAEVPAEGMKWAKSQLNVGDVVYIGPSKDGKIWELMQVPKVSGGIVVMDPHSGRVHALVGGFSYDESEFNRATQALRQPGSSFKPFIYAAALEQGYTPSTVVMDAPIEIDQGNGQPPWKPQNYTNKFYGPSTLRKGIEQSRNVMTVRLAQDMGMPLVSDYARRFGIYDDLRLFLSNSLGSTETTALRMTAAYSMLANGGRKITPTLIDRIQNRWGKTIFRHDTRPCRDCTNDRWENQDEPILSDVREQILSEQSAYQITSMLEGVVQRGTAKVVKEVERPLAGKTGTTNDYRDAWFVGYSPDLAVGVYVGFDKPKRMGRTATGGSIAAPIFKDFMMAALADEPAVPFRVPEGLEFYKINGTTGIRAKPGEANVIQEVFKVGTVPPDDFSIIGHADELGRPFTVSPESDTAVISGTGGLY